MSLRERQVEFKFAVQADKDYTENTKYSSQFGFSNSARLIENGLFVCTANLERYTQDLLAGTHDNTDQFVFISVLTFPPEDELYFSVFVKKDAGAVDQGLKKLATTTTAQKKNNNLKVYLSENGRLYFRDSGFWDSLNEDLSGYPSAKVDKILYAIHPPGMSAGQSLLSRQFVGYLGKLLDRKNVHELNVWEAERSISHLMRRMPSSLGIGNITESIEKQCGHYIENLIDRYHTALNFHPNKHFVILTGLSGTGKTLLTIKYAKAIHGIEQEQEEDPLLYVCPVRPEWTDPSGLTGYYDVLSNRYVVPTFLEAILMATVHDESPVFVVLDEMNIARVEYYLSDVLSAMETGSPLQLHSSAIPLEGSTGGEILSHIPIPNNLFITGTINIDETTNPVSDKVLDRAIVIDMSDVELTGFLDKLMKREPSLTKSRKACEGILVETNELLSEHQLGFGYRVAEEFLRYHLFATEQTKRDPNEVIDELLVQKVLIKLRGSEKQRTLLESLAQLYSSKHRAKAVIGRLLNDLNDMGSFQNTR